MKIHKRWLIGVLVIAILATGAGPWLGVFGIESRSGFYGPVWSADGRHI